MSEGVRQEWITLHDGDASKRQYPDGRPVWVKADAITVLRGYDEGHVRTVVGVNGSWLHVTETKDEILSMIL